MTQPVLLVDYGGVLTSSLGAQFVKACADHGLDTEAVIQACFGPDMRPDHPVFLLETGAITREEFRDRFDPLLREHATGDRLDTPAWLDAISGSVELVDETMVALVRDIAEAGVRVALVSNSWGPRESYPWALLPEFELEVISGEVGLRKPDPAIYLLAAERMGVDPASCVFVDDLELNIRAAREVGMTGIVHVDIETTRKELVRHFGELAVLSGSSQDQGDVA